MQELTDIRLQCLELAIKAGATTDNAIRVAKDYEDWVCSGLELEITTEIDWSRPQLVKSTYNSCIVATNGKHSEHAFSGVVVVDGSNGRDKVGRTDDDWSKKSFIYHGEIPTEQK